MNKKKVSYNTQVQSAIMAGKSDKAHDVIGRVLAEMVNGALEFAQSYPFDDLPFVIVAMKVAVDAAIVISLGLENALAAARK